MNKRLLISLLTLTMGLHLTGCTSDNSAQDSEESVVSSDDSFSEENAGDFEEGGEAQASVEGTTEGGESVDDTALEGEPMAEGSDQAAAPTEGDAAPAEGAETDELALDDGGDPANEFPDEVAGTEDAAPVDGAAPTDEMATTETAAAPTEEPTDAALFDPAAGGEQPADQAATEPPVVDDTVPTDSSYADTGSTTDAATSDFGTTDVVASEPAPKPYLPLLKIKDAPFEKDGALLNRYYIAREGDTTKSVSEKIYGSNRSKDLKNWNVLLANRPMKVGDKVYYNSPKDPADSSKMISWYEEQGLAPTTYTAQEGDNIRDLSEKLFGNRNSWKELWATNMDVESKGALPAGTTLSYFPADASQQAVASNATPETAAPAPADQAMNQPMDQGLPPDDPTLNQQPDIAMNPPGQDFDSANTGTVAPPMDNMAPPPPPPDMAQAAPPPPPMEPMQAPPPPKPTTRAAAADEEMAGDPDQTMMLGAAGLLLLGGVLAFSVVRRKRASKRIDMTQTQI